MPRSHRPGGTPCPFCLQSPHNTLSYENRYALAEWRGDAAKEQGFLEYFKADAVDQLLQVNAHFNGTVQAAHKSGCEVWVCIISWKAESLMINWLANLTCDSVLLLPLQTWEIRSGRAPSFVWMGAWPVHCPLSFKRDVAGLNGTLRKDTGLFGVAIVNANDLRRSAHHSKHS